MTAGQRVIVRAAAGERPADLCADLTVIAGGIVPRTSHGGFLVDDVTALAYLQQRGSNGYGAAPERDVEPDTAEPAPDPAATDLDPITTSPERAPADAAGPARPRRVPARKAAMKGRDTDGE